MQKEINPLVALFAKAIREIDSCVNYTEESMTGLVSCANTQGK